MKHLALAALASALLAGCTTTYASPVEVTRFVGAAPAVLGRGPIAIRAGTGIGYGSPEQAAFETAVANELRQLGYTTINGEAPQVAEVWIERALNQPGVSRSPVSVGVGGSTGSYGSGVGLGVGINLGGRPKDLINRQLRVIIRPSAGGTALWEGRARFSASTNDKLADPAAAAVRLADALFSGFPGRSGETIEVR